MSNNLYQRILTSVKLTGSMYSFAAVGMKVVLQEGVTVLLEDPLVGIIDKGSNVGRIDGNTAGG